MRFLSKKCIKMIKKCRFLLIFDNFPAYKIFLDKIKKRCRHLKKTII